MSDQPHPSCVGDYETISDDNRSVCPSCKSRGTLVPDVMPEEGVNYPIVKCTTPGCGWWG